jgi:hypothetical protein
MSRPAATTADPRPATRCSTSSAETSFRRAPTGPSSLITAGGEEIEAGPGDIVVVEPNTAHRFRNLGPTRLEIVCIHAAGRMVTRWL